MMQSPEVPPQDIVNPKNNQPDGLSRHLLRSRKKINGLNRSLTVAALNRRLFQSRDRKGAVHTIEPFTAARTPGASREWPAYLIIVAVYVCSILLVNPRGEFPLNDDWSYARSAFRLGVENRLVVDEFSAPNLVGQALYGGLLIKLFGPSFLILRLSTLALSCGLACLLWKTLGVSGVGRNLAWFAVLSWVFNPVQFCLSFTYMTEIPFLFLIAAAALAFSRHAIAPKTWPLLICGAALGYAFLIRQTSVLFMAPVAFCLLVGINGLDLRQKMLRLAAWSASAGIFVAGFYLWIQSHGGSTPATRRKFELLRHLSLEQILGNLYGLSFYLSFFLLPLLACMVPLLWTEIARSGRKKWSAVSASWALVAVSGLWWFHARYSGGSYLPGKAFHGQMPYLLNILFDTGLGPLTLDPTYYGPPPTPVHPQIWFAVTLLAAAGLALLGTLLTLGGLRFRRYLDRPGQRELALFSVAALTAVILFEVVFSHTQEGGLFDRHILTAALPMLLLVCLIGYGIEPAGGKDRGPHPEAPRQTAPVGRVPFTFVAALMIAVMAYFCITATHDYLAWNRLRWDLGNELLAQKVDPLTVSGGFEFNGWHNYDAFRARGNVERVYYWWYDRLDYLITMEPQEEYHVLKRLDYFSWLHRRELPVYLLKKN